MSDNGKPVATELEFYGKGKLLLTLDKPTPKFCFIVARIDEAGTFGDIGFAMDKALGVHGAARKEEPNTVYWVSPDHIFQMKMTGKTEEPSVRIAVGYHAAEKK